MVEEKKEEKKEENVEKKAEEKVEVPKKFEKLVKEIEELSVIAEPSEQM